MKGKQMPVKPDFSEFMLNDDEVAVMCQKIIGRTAMEKNFAIQRDDPIMVLPVMIKILMEDYVNRQAQILNKTCEFQAATVDEFRAALKTDLSNIVGGVMHDFDNRVKKAVDEAMNYAKQEIRKEVDNSIAAIQHTDDALKKIYHYFVVAGILAAVGGVAALATAVKLIQVL